MNANLRLSLINLGLVLTLSAHSEVRNPLGDWRLIQEQGSFYALSDDFKLKLRLHIHTGKPKLLSWQPRVHKSHRNIGLLTYYAGISDENQKSTEVHRAFIIHTSKKKVLGDAPIKYIPQEKNRVVFSPKWEWKEDRVKVTDFSYNEKLTFVLE